MTIRVGILNYADVRNFGDVLFPLVVEKEVRTRIPSVEITFITHTGTSWGDMTSKRIDQIDFESFDALLLGGGEIVHRLDGMLSRIYSGFGLEAVDSPTDLVFSWTGAKRPYKAWLGLGVPAPFSDAAHDIASASAFLSVVGVRGSHSHQRVLSSGVDAHLVRRTPDLGWLFPRLLNNQRFPVHPADGRWQMACHTLPSRHSASLIRWQL